MLKKPVIRKRQDRKFDINELTSTMVAGTATNSKTLCEKINTLMEWEPGFLYFDRINRECDVVVQKLIDYYKIDDVQNFRVKTSQVNTLLKITDINDDYRFFLYVRNMKQNFSVDVIKNKIDWTNELLRQFKTWRQERSPRGIISCLYSFGFLLHPNDLFDTTLVDSDGHYLSLDESTWTIRQSGKDEVVVQLPKELVLLLRTVVTPGRWLIMKNNNEQYKMGASRTLAYHGIPYRLKKIRESYLESNPDVEYSHLY